MLLVLLCACQLHCPASPPTASLASFLWRPSCHHSTSVYSLSAVSLQSVAVNLQSGCIRTRICSDLAAQSLFPASLPVTHRHLCFLLVLLLLFLLLLFFTLFPHPTLIFMPITSLPHPHLPYFHILFYPCTTPYNPNLSSSSSLPRESQSTISSHLVMGAVPFCPLFSSC